MKHPLPRTRAHLPKPYEQPTEDDAGIKQGRNEHHRPERDRDILVAVLLTVGPWIGVALIALVIALALAGVRP